MQDTHEKARLEGELEVSVAERRRLETALLSCEYENRGLQTKVEKIRSHMELLKTSLDETEQKELKTKRRKRKQPMVDAKDANKDRNNEETEILKRIKEAESKVFEQGLANALALVADIEAKEARRRETLMARVRELEKENVSLFKQLERRSNGDL